MNRQNEDKNFTEVNKNQEYIKQSVVSGSFFSDSKDWFYEKYVSTYKSRLNLTLVTLILAFFIVFMLISSIFSILSVSPKNGVVSLESEFEDEFIIQKITKHYNNNEKNILRFVVENYINFFESYNVDKFTIYKLNEQIDTIKKYSNKNISDKFQKIAQTNYTPEIFAGLTRCARITSFEFEYPENDFQNQITRFIFPENTPNKVKVSVISTIYKDSGRFVAKEERRNIEITFKYKPLQKDKEGNFNDLEFQVIGYNYLNI